MFCPDQLLAVLINSNTVLCTRDDNAGDGSLSVNDNILRHWFGQHDKANRIVESNNQKQSRRAEKLARS